MLPIRRILSHSLFPSLLHSFTLSHPFLPFILSLSVVTDAVAAPRPWQAAWQCCSHGAGGRGQQEHGEHPDAVFGVQRRQERSLWLVLVILFLSISLADLLLQASRTRTWSSLASTPTAAFRLCSRPRSCQRNNCTFEPLTLDAAQVIKNTLNPIWKPALTNLTTLCNGDVNRKLKVCLFFNNSAPASFSRDTDRLLRLG